MTSQSQLETAQLAAMHAQTAPSPLGIPSPAVTEVQRLKAANAELRARVAELEVQIAAVPRLAIYRYWRSSKVDEKLCGIGGTADAEAAEKAVHAWLMGEQPEAQP